MKQKSPRGAWWWSWIFMMSKEPRFLLIFNKITPPKKYLLLKVRTKKGQFLNIYLGLPSLSFHAGCYFPPDDLKTANPSVAFITDTFVFTAAWTTEQVCSYLSGFLRADGKNAVREKLRYSFQLGRLVLAVIYQSQPPFPPQNETRALNSMLYNVLRPPHELCLKTAKKRVNVVN